VRYAVGVPLVFGIAVAMAMVGRGGGNFYVPSLILAGSSMHQAATTGQLILVCTALAALLIYGTKGVVDWKLALVIDPPTDVMALVGGYFAHWLPGSSLKLVFAGLLVLAGFLMLGQSPQDRTGSKRKFGFWRRHFAGYDYVVNLWLAIPITAATGLVAGMVGISGGSFKIPLMVLACGVPMRTAIGTSSAMVAATALMGFIGHSAAGDLNVGWALPTAAAAVAGGLVGGALSLKTDPARLKKLFAYSTLLAAAFMTWNAVFSPA